MWQFKKLSRKSNRDNDKYQFTKRCQIHFLLDPQKILTILSSYSQQMICHKSKETVKPQFQVFGHKVSETRVSPKENSKKST